MKSDKRTRFLVFLAISSLSAIVGCARSPGPSNSSPGAVAAEFLLTDEPADAIGVIECRTRLEAAEGPQDVVVIGQIDGLGQPTWDPERAIFMIADLSLATSEDQQDQDLDAKHDADNCPFCRAKKKKELAGLAMIQVVDATGQNPSVDARDLLGLEDGATIVICGTAELDSIGTLCVQTSKIFVRPLQALRRRCACYGCPLRSAL